MGQDSDEKVIEFIMKHHMSSYITCRTVCAGSKQEMVTGVPVDSVFHMLPHKTSAFTTFSHAWLAEERIE